MSRTDPPPTPRRIGMSWVLLGALLLAFALIPARPWIALAYHASSYPVTGASDAANVAMYGSFAFVSRAHRGYEIIDCPSGKILAVIPPPSNTSVDDLAIAGDLLFTLDARPPGHLSVFSLEHPRQPRLVSPPVAVAVGPFSGVSAGGGRVIVSGGTSPLSLRTYDGRGKLSPVLATIDLGRGQPDVLLDPAGRRAFVSTHRWGPYFELTMVRLTDSPPFLTKAGSLDLDTYGFTPGGAKPASFPLETALSGDVLLVADHRGLSVLSVESLDHPRLLAKLDTGVKAVNVDVRDHLAAIVGSSPEPRLVLVDFSNPSSPRITRTIPLPDQSQPTGVAISGDHLAVAAGQHGALLFHL